MIDFLMFMFVLPFNVFVLLFKYLGSLLFYGVVVMWVYSQYPRWWSALKVKFNSWNTK